MAPGGDAIRPHRVPRDLADPLLAALGDWLDVGAPTAVAATVIGDGRPGSWPDARTEPALRRLITAHGLSPVLVRDPAAAATVARLVPESLLAWLAAQDERNRLRIERLLGELQAVLRAFRAASLPVMPLKGAILATRPGSDPFRRPMADLDLLVRPGDRVAARATLTSLGYRRRLDRTRRPTHDTFEIAGNETVVAVDGEDPDNPRRIELHTEVRRHLWAWMDDDDLTGHLWSGSVEATILGEPAIVPTVAALGAHLAIHATSDLLLGKGRLIQWLDLAEVLGSAATAIDPGRAGGRTAPTGLVNPPHPRLVAPAVRLAARRLPGRFPAGGPAGLEALEQLVPTTLARWAAEVPLDTRAGLHGGRWVPADASTVGARWARWAPHRWRLAVAYGDAPLVVAAARHAARVLVIARQS